MATTCTSDIYFRDFDGSAESMPCGQPATHVIVTRTPSLRYEVEHEGGWDAYRAHILAFDGADPGEDPGSEKWGDTTETVCADHARELRHLCEECGTDGLYGFTILSDIATRES